MIFEIKGRRTGRGAYTDAEVIRPDGTRAQPNAKDSSGSGNHWTSRWRDVGNCLILVTDFTNSGKDNSYIPHQPDSLTPEQEAALKQFKTEHWLD